MDYLVAPDRLEHGSFVLRSYLPGDGDAVFEAVSASREHLAPWMPWAREEGSVEASERTARQFRGRYLLATEFVLAIFDPSERRLLGGTGFHLKEGPLSSRSAEVGMWIRSDEAGRGLGTRVLVALLRWGLEDWPWERLLWRCDARNTASQRVAEKAGMRLEGTLRRQWAGAGEPRRDTLSYAALRGDWAPPVGSGELRAP